MYVTTFILCFALTAAATRDVNRLNYGLYFEYKHTIRPVTNIWRHTFAINLPSMQFTISPPKVLMPSGNLNGTIPWEPPLNKNNQALLKKGSYIHHDELPMVQEIHQKLRLLVARLFYEGHRSLNEQVSMIYDLLPENEKIGIGESRSQRAIFPFVGSILNSLFGTSTTEDTDTLKRHMMEIAQTQNNEMTIMKKQTAAMSNFATQSTERMDKLAEAMKQSLDDNMHMMHVYVDNTLLATRYQTSMLSYAIILENSIQTLQTKYAELLGAVENLINGNLSPFLIPSATITKTLEDIRKHLAAEEQKYEIIYTKASFYYHRGSFVLAREANTSFICVQIPLTTFQTNFAVYEIKQYPLPMPNSEQNIMKLTGIPNGLAIDASREYFYTLTKEELDDVGVHHHAHERNFFSKSTPRNCLMAIFHDEKHEVDRLCPYEIITNDLKPSVFRVTDSTYLLIKVDSYTQQCPNEITQVSGCKSCLVSPGPKCTLTHEQWLITPTLTKSENSEAIDRTHLTNIPFLVKFFDNKTLSTLRGDDVYVVPPNITLPEFKYLSLKVTETFVAQECISHDLIKTAQAVLNNKYIVDNLGQSLILGYVELDKDLFWVSSKGIVVELSLVATLLLLLNCVYLFFRLRKLSVAMLLLQANGLPRTEATQDKRLQLNYFDEATPAVGGNFADSRSQTFIQLASNHAAYTYMGFVTAVIIAIIARKTYKKVHKHCLNKTHCVLALEFLQNGQALMIRVMKFDGTPAQYTVSASQFIDSVDVSRILNPKLSITWQSLQIKNNLTGMEIALPRVIPIPVITAYHLRIMLQQPFECFPLWVRNRERLRIEVTRHDPTSGHPPQDVPEITA
jgi:hypothetical protein